MKFNIWKFNFSLIAVLSSLFLLLQFSLPIQAQTPFNVVDSLNPNQTNGAITDQTKIIQEIQQDIKDLEDKKNELLQKQTNLEDEILEKEVKETELAAKNSLLQDNLLKTNEQIKNNNQKLQELKNAGSSSSRSLQNQEIELTAVINSLENSTKNITGELSETARNLSTLQSEIILKKTELEGIKTEIKSIEASISEKKSLVNLSYSGLQSTLFREARYWLFYVLLLIFYWGIFRIVLFILKKKLKKSNFLRFAQVITTIIWVLISFFTAIAALVQKIEVLQQAWAVFALISWAVAWALKDFFASFFSYILLLSSREFVVGDIIKIHESLGKVIKIGVFNTTIKEITDRGDLKESFSGQTVTIPNNKIMVEPVTNYTKQHKIIWRSFKLVFSDDTDLETTKKRLNKILTDLFTWSVDHKDEYLDNVYNLRTVYEPRMNLVPGKDGPTFLIQFPIRFGGYGKVVDRLTNELYTAFRKKNIELLSVESLN